MLTINSKIYEKNGNITVKNTNSGDITINPIDEDTITHPTLVSDSGNIKITNEGTSDLIQKGGIRASGSIEVMNKIIPNSHKRTWFLRHTGHTLIVFCIIRNTAHWTLPRSHGPFEFICKS